MSEESLSAPTQTQHVCIAEIKVATSGILKATLGSCVTFAAIDSKRGICGMAHCLLPKSPEGSMPKDARFVDCALTNLLLAMGAEPEYRRGLTLYLAGGAQMVSKGPSIGELNVAAAKAVLYGQRLPWKVLDVGGLQGCTVILDCEKLTIHSRRIDSMTAKNEA